MPAPVVVPFVVGGALAHLSKLFHNHRLAQPLLQAAGRAQAANDQLVGLMRQYKSHSLDTLLYGKAKSHLTALIAARDELQKNLRSLAASSLSIEQKDALDKTLQQVNGWVATGQKFLQKLTPSVQASSTTEVDEWQEIKEKAGEQGAAIATAAEALGVTPEQVASMLNKMTAAAVLALLQDVNLAIGGGGGGGSGRPRVATAAAPGDRPIQRLIRQVKDVLAEGGGSTSADFNATEWLLSWLARPCAALSKRRPAEILGTESGVKRLLDVIGAMASGSYL